VSTALRSLVVTHSGGTRVLPLYQVATRTRSFSATGQIPKGSPRRTRVIGDRLEDPSELSVTVYLEEASLALSYALAYAVIEDCESATSVSYHEGVQLVDGITRAAVAVDNLGVRVSISFAPTSALFEPLLTADNTTILADTTLITADATVFP
jgi:hypothetical protein